METKTTRKAIALLFGAALLTAGPLEALARAGGGQHFGSRGAGGGGFGGGGLFSLWPLLFFGHGSGFSGIIVLLVIFYFYQQMQGRRAQPWMPTPLQEPYAASSVGVSGGIGALPIDPQATAAGVAALKAKDPNFNEQEFLDRAQTAFFKVQAAWAGRNQDLARDVMSQSLYERHKMQTDQLLAAHRVDVLENIVIGHARIIDVTASQPYDSISVDFTASMTDYTVDETTRRIVDGNQFPQTFTERWTFIRRSDAKSTVAATTLASSCPSCGAPLKLTNGKCDFCGAFVKTTSSDWVVDTIEQIA
ncbi:MAG: Tim44 domain-containing protein [Candidatus Eremiobacteraeota bacterium]|nr:Tim44 domain-containing protein [Candidatus Eremiobacteraeota bacterium]MBC5828092.1 Tim44 domain-containing protein [Candidatus Eremiobacteraeota bacterium]